MSVDFLDFWTEEMSQDDQSKKSIQICKCFSVIYQRTLVTLNFREESHRYTFTPTSSWNPYYFQLIQSYVTKNHTEESTVHT